MADFERTLIGAQRFTRGHLSSVYARSLAGAQPEPTGVATIELSPVEISLSGFQRSGTGQVTTTSTFYRYLNGSTPEPFGMVSTVSRTMLGATDEPSGTVSASLYMPASLAGVQPEPTGSVSMTGGTFTRYLSGTQPQRG